MSKTRTQATPSGQSPLRGKAGRLDGIAIAPRLATDVFSLRINYSAPYVGGYANVMHFQPQSPPSGEVTEILADLIGGFQDNAQDVILAAMAQDCRLISYQAHRVTGGSPTITDVVDLAGLVVGTVDNTALASNLNFVPTAAPWNYGHFYLCGIPDVDFTENRFTPNYLTLAGNVAAKVSSAFVGNVPAVTA